MMSVCVLTSLENLDRDQKEPNELSAYFTLSIGLVLQPDTCEERE